MAKRGRVQLLLEGVPAFSPEHSAHELQSLNVHFLASGDLSRAHQPLHPATSAYRALVVVVNKALSTSLQAVKQAALGSPAHTQRQHNNTIFINSNAKLYLETELVWAD